MTSYAHNPTAFASLKAAVTMHFDGGSRGNPGLSAGSAVIYHPDCPESIKVTKVLQHATNNEAEYTGLIIGLKKAIELGVQEITIKGDSQLVVNQVNGAWGVNKPHLDPLMRQARSLLRQFKSWQLFWHPRAENAEADEVCNYAMDRAMGIPEPTVADVMQEIKQVGNPQIDRLNKLGSKASFKDVAGLKVPGGKDEFTKLRLPALSELAGPTVVEEIKLLWLERNEVDLAAGKDGFDLSDRELASILRWFLRGLTIDLATRKVRTGLEIAANCR